MSDTPPVIAINSLVSRGSVGGRASLFALERLGFPVVLVPTVLLPWHPGHGPGTRIAVDAALIAAQAERPPFPAAAGILTGYFGAPDQVSAAAGLIEAAAEAGRAPLVLCDPVVGDAGRFYVAEDTRQAVRRLAAVADIVTPNAFELGFLAGIDVSGISDNAGLVAMARSLGRPEVVVTSAFAGEGETGNLLVTRGGADLFAHPALARAPHGTGDLLAALYLGHRLGGAMPRDALERATATTLSLVKRAGEAAELPLAAGGDAVLAPPEGVRIDAVGG